MSPKTRRPVAVRALRLALMGSLIVPAIFTAPGPALGNVLVNQDPPGAIQNSPSIIRDGASGNLVAAYTSSPFAPVGIGASYSVNGGASWITSVLQPPGGGWFGTQLDASTVSDGAGFVYSGLASYDQLPPWGARSGIFVHASNDGGVTFGAPAAVSVQMGMPGTIPFEIKPKVEADDFAASPYYRQVYCAWERDVTDWIHSDACFARAPQGGAIWSPAVTVNDQPALDFVLWPDLAVAPNGDVHVTWLDTPFWAQQQGFQGRILADRSVNGGATFGQDRLASTFWTVPTNLTDAFGMNSYPAMSYTSTEVDPSNSNRICVAYAARPNSGPYLEARLDTGDQPPGSADAGRYSSFYGGSRVSAAGGWVYAVWEDLRSGIWEVYFRRTPSNNPTWSTGEVLVSTIAGGHAGSNVPTIASDGPNVWVAWMDVAGPIPNYVFLNRSSDNGATWLATPLALDNLASQGASCPVVAASGNNVCVAWEAVMNPGIVHDIRVNRSTDGGQTWLANEVSLTGGVLATQHAIAISGNTACAVWAQAMPGGITQILSRRSTDAGQTWAAPVQLDSAPMGATTRWGPKIACSGTNFYAIWQDNRVSGVTDDIYFSGSTDGGVTWSLDTPLSGPGTSHNSYAHLACFGNDVHVVYTSNRNNIPQGRTDIYANSSFNAGQSWNGEVRLNQTPAGTRQTAYPRIALSGPRVFVVWQDDRNGAPFSGWDIYGTHSINGGMTWPGADYRIDIGSLAGASTSEYPDIAADAGSGFYAWRDQRNGLGDIYANALIIGQDEADIFYIESRDGGATWTPSIRVNDDNTTRDQSHPWLDVKPNGTVDVVWYDKRNDPNDRNPDVYFAALLPGMGAFQQNVLVTTQPIQAPPGSWLGDYNGLEVDGPTAHMVWTDMRRDPGNGDIFYDNRPNPSPPSFGACCLPDGTCAVMTALDCAAAGGQWKGEGVPCEPDPCVELPDWDDHDVGNCRLTVTDRGILGFLDDSQSQGSGFIYPGMRGNQLFIGGFWLSDAGGYVANREYSADPAQEWTVSLVPDGRVQEEPVSESDQDLVAMFRDDAATEPRGLLVRQESWAFAGPPEIDDFVMIRYVIENTSPLPLEGVIAGFFLDLDLEGTPFDDGGAGDPSLRLVHMSDPNGMHVGVAALGGADPLPLANLSLIHNPTYVWPNQYILDPDKLAFLSGLDPEHRVLVSHEANDWSLVASVGPFALAPGESREAAFALLGAGSLEELQAEAEMAEMIYFAGPSGAPDGSVEAPGALRLLPNLPNPFAGSTDLRFELAGAGRVSLEVFDVGGRRVRHVFDGEMGAGPHRLAWDGRDGSGQLLPAGKYFIRLWTADSTRSRAVVRIR